MSTVTWLTDKVGVNSTFSVLHHKILFKAVSRIRIKHTLMQTDSSQQKHNLPKLHSLNKVVTNPSKKAEMDLHPHTTVYHAERE